MRHDNGRVGFLLLINQGSKGWKHPADKSDLSFNQVVEYLAERAKSIVDNSIVHNSKTKLHLQVIGIDLTC
jgi:hypothetical protein